MNMLMNSVSEITVAPTIATSWARSLSGETRSFSRNWRRKSFVSSRYATASRVMSACLARSHVGEIARDRFRVIANDELRKHRFQRRARRQRPQPRDRIVGLDDALVEDDDAIGDFLDD